VTASGKILVVDDHVDLAENIAEILQMAGYQTAIAHSAEAALELLDGGGLSGLITDFRLPGRSGAQLIAELRRRGNPIPALVMSAYTDDETISSAQQAGAAHVLSKPVDIPRLLCLMETLGGDEDLILVIDDNRALAENIAEALEHHGHRAAVCTTAGEALGHRRGARVAIIDFRLPDATGVEVAQQLRSRDPGMSLLFVSAHGPELQAALDEQLPGARAMDKPLHVPELLAWVEEVLRGQRRAR
jgi:DNA-binding response OmpR family regulator